MAQKKWSNPKGKKRMKFGGKEYTKHSTHRIKKKLREEYAKIENTHYGRTVKTKKGYVLYTRQK